MGEDMNQFDHGYNEAINRILCHIEFRRMTYEKREEVEKYVALNMLYEEIKLIFNVNKE